MNRLPDPVRITSPVRISATQVETARDCLLRFLLDGQLEQKDMALPSPSPYRYAGMLLHGLIEDARKGRAGSPPERELLAERWRERLEETHERASQNGDGAWLPLQSSIKNLERTRLSAIDLAERQTARSSAGGGGQGSTEAWLHAHDERVLGRVDAIDTVDGVVTLRDFKSGALVESTGELKSGYVTQMLIYAALAFEQRGAWPDALELVDRRGEAVPVPYSYRDAAAALQRAVDTLEHVRDRVGEGGWTGDRAIDELAGPENGACLGCRHRPLCSAYRARLDDAGYILMTDSRFPLVDLAGSVSEVRHPHNGTVSIELRSAGAERLLQGLGVSGRFGQSDAPPEEELCPGDTVSVFNAMPRRPIDVQSDPTHFVATQSTVAYTISRAAVSP